MQEVEADRELWQVSVQGRDQDEDSPEPEREKEMKVEEHRDEADQ